MIPGRKIYDGRNHSGENELLKIRDDSGRIIYDERNHSGENELLNIRDDSGENNLL
jgi:hypothetical protein